MIPCLRSPINNISAFLCPLFSVQQPFTTIARFRCQAGVAIFKCVAPRMILVGRFRALFLRCLCDHVGITGAIWFVDCLGGASLIVCAAWRVQEITTYCPKRHPALNSNMNCLEPKLHICDREPIMFWSSSAILLISGSNPVWSQSRAGSRGLDCPDTGTY